MTENSDAERSAPRPDDAPQAPSFGSPPPPPPYTPPPPPPQEPGYGTPPATPGYGDPGAGGYPPQGGGYSPQGGGYAPQGGSYPPQPGAGGYAPSGAPGDDTKTWNMISHFGGSAGVVIGGGVLGFVGPLISMMAKGNENPAVRGQAVEALNFQITWAIGTVVAWLLYVCGSIVTLGFGALILWILPLATAIIAIVFGIIAGIKSNNGEAYKYPMTMRMVK